MGRWGNVNNVLICLAKGIEKLQLLTILSSILLINTLSNQERVKFPVIESFRAIQSLRINEEVFLVIVLSILFYIF